MPTDSKKLRAALTATALWTIALIVAFLLDRPVAQALRDSGIAARFKGTLLAEILKVPGDFWFTAVAALLLTIFHPWHWRAGGLVCLAALVSGMNSIIKWTAGRLRPFKAKGHPDELFPFQFDPFIGGISGLFNVGNVCFPSGHAALAFATAQMLAMLIPRWRWLFYAGASLVGLERVLENAHWVSDVVAAALLGVVGAKIVWWLCELVVQQLRADADAPPVPSPGTPLGSRGNPREVEG